MFVLLAAAALDASAQISAGFDKLEVQLRIRPEQKRQYDLAVAATQRALLAVGLAVMQMKERLAEELLKPQPDFAALGRANEAVIEQAKPLFREARDEWGRLMKILDADQVEIVKQFLRDHLNRFLNP
jgi:hypothetical protein